MVTIRKICAEVLLTFNDVCTLVALKRINVDMIDDRAREKCLKEVRLMQSLDHPNVIKYLDSFISENDLGKKLHVSPFVRY